MIKLINYFVDVCLLRRGPQDAPASSALLLLVLIINLVISSIGVSDIIPGAKAVAAAIVDAIIIIVFLQLVLKLKNRSDRFIQTATATFGTGALLGMLALPLQLAVGSESAGNGSQSIAIFYLVLLVWVQVVIGHILRHALNVPFSLGIGLALVYSVLSGVLIQSLFIQSSAI